LRRTFTLDFQRLQWFFAIYPSLFIGPVRILYPEVQYQRSFFTPLESEAAKPA
jgi:hypothetical protein